jgi:hypothetical protein
MPAPGPVSEVMGFSVSDCILRPETAQVAFLVSVSLACISRRTLRPCAFGRLWDFYGFVDVEQDLAKVDDINAANQHCPTWSCDAAHLPQTWIQTSIRFSAERKSQATALGASETEGIINAFFM